jgi:hypothetical protein
MNPIKSYSRRSFALVVFFVMLMVGALGALIYFGKIELSAALTLVLTPEVPGDAIGRLLDTYALYLMAGAAGIVLLLGIISWLILRAMVKGLFGAAGARPEPGRKTAAADGPGDGQVLGDQRLFLHLLTVLQREGRLVDFFQEDLDRYADDQIGAAVRTIHDSCRKVLSKRLALAPVVGANEGEAMTVVAGFDPDAIKLTGRVTGDPPFAGVVRHKGWRVLKLNLPDLTAINDPSIVAPAEVEIE